MAAEAEASREARAKVNNDNNDNDNYKEYDNDNDNVDVKVIAADGEMRASKALREASMIIEQSPAALQLRYLQVALGMLYRVFNAKVSSVILQHNCIKISTMFLP